MTRRVVAYHIVFGAYGFWLPNDPRGSWSRYVGARALRPFGLPHGVRPDTTLSVAEAQTLKQMRQELSSADVRFTAGQTACIAAAFDEILTQLRQVVYAAALMPDHVHLVVARQEIYAETLTGFLKRAASRRLRQAGLHPLASYSLSRGRLPSPWCEHGWHLFLFTHEELEHAIEYVQGNPGEAGLPAQSWGWTRRYEP